MIQLIISMSIICLLSMPAFAQFTMGSLGLGDKPSISCGCSAYEITPQRLSGKLIYEEGEIDNKKILRMNLDSKSVDLIKTSKPIDDKYLVAAVGKSYTEKLSNKDTSVTCVWKAISTKKDSEEAVRSTEFDVDFIVNKKGKKKTIRATGYCGC